MNQCCMMLNIFDLMLIIHWYLVELQVSMLNKYWSNVEQSLKQYLLNIKCCSYKGEPHNSTKDQHIINVKTTKIQHYTTLIQCILNIDSMYIQYRLNVYSTFSQVLFNIENWLNCKTLHNGNHSQYWINIETMLHSVEF